MVKLCADDKASSINGINVMMDGETQIRAEAVTIAANHGELVILDGAESCCS